MYELIQIAEHSYYIRGAVKTGLVVLKGREVCLIDSGGDKDAGRRIRQILDANHWTLTAIYHTHSHADHIGGNKYLQAHSGCKIYAPGVECDFTRHPVLEPAFVYGGYPCKDLRHKFLLAQESAAEYLSAEVLPEGWTVIKLPGHSFDMVGFRTPDGVIYLGDCLLSRETLDKYGIGFVYDVAASLQTLEKVKTLEARAFVPAHAEVTDDISSLAQYNIDKVREAAGTILDFCKEPLSFEAILQKLFARYELVMNFEQYVLVGSTLRSYLAWLKDEGRLNVRFENNMLLWEKALNSQ